MSNERIAASVRQRLITLHRHVNVSHELLMRRYAFERLLDRLSQSEFRRELCLKIQPRARPRRGHVHNLDSCADGAGWNSASESDQVKSNRLKALRRRSAFGPGAD